MNASATTVSRARRVVFVVNSLADLVPSMTTTRLLLAAGRAGHETCVVGLAGVGLSGNGDPLLDAVSLTPAETPSDTLAALRNAARGPLVLARGDVVLARVNPARFGSPAQHELMLAMLEQAEALGVRVVNSPRGLRRVGSKALLSTLAPGDCPAQRVVSSVAAAARAALELGPQLVLKPVQGSRGIGVLFVDTNVADVKPLAELLLERGPLIVQQRVPGAEQGDLRVLIVNGAALRVEDRPVVIARRPASGELRSNLHQGASAQLGELGERELALIGRIAPRLVALGLSIVGADLMQGRLLELNVYAPGGVGPFESLTGIDVSSALLRSLLEPE